MDSDQVKETYGTLPGGAGDRTLGAKRPKHRRVNIIGVLVALYLPFIIFCGGAGLVIYALASDMSMSSLALMVGLGIGIIVMCAASCASLCKKKHDDAGGHSWSPFIWSMGIVAFIVAMMFGYYIGSDMAEAFANLSNLATYKDVNPAKTRGQELMDAGQIVFRNDTRVDIRRAIGFKNVVTYCVAPITSTDVSSNLPLSLQVYDFWAVGRDCCTSEGASEDFACGQASNRKAHSGLRVMRDKDRPFYRLAVRQAEAAYHLKALHPLFFEWVGDPEAELEAIKRAAFKSFLSGVFAFFVLQLVVVVVALCCFKRFLLGSHREDH